jgi:hypothetical protein
MNAALRHTARVPPDTSPGQPVFRALEQPRSPSTDERRLLLWLASAIGLELIMRQVEEAVVVTECGCGCSSVQLSTAAAPLPADVVSWFSNTGRPDYLSVSSIGIDTDGHVVSVVLHVADGRLRELEVFDTDAGEGKPVDLAALPPLQGPEIG